MTYLLKTEMTERNKLLVHILEVNDVT